MKTPKEPTIGCWDVSKVTNMGDMFSGATLSTDNYDTTLIGWASKTLTPNVVFSGGNSRYCNIENARTPIINSYGWTLKLVDNTSVITKKIILR